MNKTGNIRSDFKSLIFDVTVNNFNELALDIFYYQAKYNSVYSKYLHLIEIRAESILRMEDIPYLPIQLFKNQTVICGELKKETLFFESSSTDGKGTSKHFVKDINLYIQSFEKAFTLNFGNIADYTFRFLLPSYLERTGSSLIYMTKHLLEKSGKGGFYLNDFSTLATDLKEDIKNKRKTILFGVSFALLDFALQYPLDLKDIIIVETGGMKGRRTELTRMELHSILKEKFQVKTIASEYGMTELLSQAYSLKDGRFITPSWMKVTIGQNTDPFGFSPFGKTGSLKIIDLANLDSCCFIETSDLGRCYEGGTFEVLGRFDQSDVRGCNLMYTN